VADHPLRPANHRSLGRPLPHQLANGTRAPPQTATFMKRSPFIKKAGAKLTISGISYAFAKLSRIQGQVTHVLLTRAPLYSSNRSRNFSFDLHVLGTPPAFILSQDQTLQLNWLYFKVQWTFISDLTQAVTLFSFQRTIRLKFF
jgi:hypothetical protein